MKKQNIYTQASKNIDKASSSIYTTNEAVEEVSEQMIEACEPPDAIMLVEEAEHQADPSLQGTPIPAELQKRLKLSVRTPMEGVPELHGSALRDMPSHATTCRRPSAIYESWHHGST
mgnify:CR=1 FL=1